MIRSWWRNRLWWRLYPPREGWVVLLDADGREVTERLPFVATPRRREPGTWGLAHDLRFIVPHGVEATSLRLVGADGRVTETPLVALPGGSYGFNADFGTPG